MWRGVEHVLIDLRFGLRQLVRSRLTTTVAILTLAVGIGMNTAVFSLVNGVLLRPLPYPDPDRLVWIAPHDDRFGRDTFTSRGDCRIWKQQAHLFEQMAAYGTQDLALVVGDEASQERIASIEGDYWAITGARPALGRLFDEGEEQSIVLSQALFQRRFGGQATVIGQSVQVNGASFAVVGVLPEGFRVTFPQQVAPGDELRDLDAFISLPRGEEAPGDIITQTDRPAPFWVRVVAKLAAGVPVAQARAEMVTLQAVLQREYRPPERRRSLRVVPLGDKLAEESRSALVVLLGAVAFVLLIATANVANLLLAQASERARDTAIRTALGAGRRRLTIQYFVESVLLALVAGAVAAIVAYVTVPLLVRSAPFSITGIADITVDGRVLVFTLLVSVATGVCFACAPVFAPSHVRPCNVLSGMTHAIVGGSTRLQGCLVGAEVALAVVLLTGAGLMVKSLWRLQSYPPGFAPERTYTMRIPLSGPRYEALERKIAYIDGLTGQLEGVPGVEAAGVSASTYTMPVTVANTEDIDPSSQPPAIAIRMVSAAYLRAMGVSLVRGRWPSADEAFDFMVVNETFARRLMPHGDPIGRTFSGAFVSGIIAGVVADVPYPQLDGQATPTLYYPYQRAPATRSIIVAVRMAASAVPTVRELVADADRTQPVYQFQRLEDALGESVAPRRFNMFLLEIYAASATIMALAGILGVVAYSVSRRTRETAVRIAVGARPIAVVFMIVGQAMTYVLAGVVAGVLASIAVGQTMRGMIYGVEPNDPATLVGVAVSLGLAALVACCVPAARAAHVDPVSALRDE